MFSSLLGILLFVLVPNKCAQEQGQASIFLLQNCSSLMHVHEVILLLMFFLCWVTHLISLLLILR